MFRQWWNNLKQKPEDGNGGSNGMGQGAGQQAQGAGQQGGGGQGTNDILFDNPGSGQANGAGNQNSAGQQGNGQANGSNSGNSGNGGGQANSQVSIPENWKEALPQELKSLKSLEKLATVADVVKSYANLETMLGRDKAVIPQKGAPAEEMRAYLEKAGLPKDIKEYTLESPKSGKVDQEFFDAYKQAAFEAGVMPEQANKLVDWFAKVNDDAYKASIAAYNDKINQEQAKLKSEWGDAYNENIARAKAALNEFATPEQREWFKQVGLGSNPDFIRLMAKAGEGLSEAKIKGEGGTGQGQMTPQEAQLKIKEIQGNIKHPYYDSKHAEHKAAKEEMAKLYKFAYPDPTPVKAGPDF